MWSLPGSRSLLTIMMTLTGAVMFLSTCTDPSAANVTPEFAMVIHVQPAGTWCATAISDCHDIVRSTPEEGQMEFVLFLYRGYSWPEEEVDVTSLTADLIWPNEWQFVSFWPYSGYGYLNPTGPVHRLELGWQYPCLRMPYLPDAVYPIGCLIMNVDGPGRIDFSSRWSNPLVVGCYGETQTTYIPGFFAEAGMACGYTRDGCAPHDWCIPAFAQSCLELRTPPGGTVHGTIDFWAGMWDGSALCPVAIDTHAPWAQAEVSPEYTTGHATILVTADASALDLGTYQTWVEVSSIHHDVARCIPVLLTVGGAAAVPPDMPPRVRLESWGKVKALYR